MNRRQFVLSWGRKLFFGLAWPLFSLIGLVYLQSFVFPQSTMEVFYYLVSFVGHYGLICAISYFFFYCPVVLLFPTYYFSRLWSMFLIILLASILFFDAYVFSQFRFHLNSYFLNLIFQQGLTAFISSKAVVILFAVAMLAGAIIIWFRGNITWRQMQKRFSNPVSNWYLALIVVSFGVSHLCRVYSSTPLHRMQALFPVNFALSGHFNDTPLKDVGRLYYPKEELKCNGRGHPNIVFIVIKGWKYDSLFSGNNPQLSHLTAHGSVYQNHYSGSTDSTSSLFSLFYSLPASYADAFKTEKKEPVFIGELKKRKYQIVSFIQGNLGREELFSQFDPQEIVNGSLLESWKSWSSGGTITPPLFAFFYYDVNQNGEMYRGDLGKIDSEVRGVVLSLLQENVLKDATFVITGDHGPELPQSEVVTEDKLKTPLMVIWPHRAHKEFKQFTSHYDVVPTLMRELWNCKSPFTSYSLGKSLNDEPKHPWHLIEVEESLALMDVQKSNFTRITKMGGFEVRDFLGRELPSSKGRAELMLKALKENYRFYKR